MQYGGPKRKRKSVRFPDQTHLAYLQASAVAADVTSFGVYRTVFCNMSLGCNGVMGQRTFIKAKWFVFAPRMVFERRQSISDDDTLVQ